MARAARNARQGAPKTPGRPWLKKGLRWGGRIAGAMAMAYALMLGVSQAYAFVTGSQRFEVRAMQFQPTPHVGEERLRELLALEPGTNILSLELDALAERIEQDPWIADASVERELPDTLAIVITEHEPKAVLHANGFFLVNADGLPFKRVERGERDGLPIITGLPAERVVRDPAAAREHIRSALALLEDYQSKRRPELSEINIDDTGFVTLVTTQRGTTLRLGRHDLLAALERFDAVRAALGHRADDLAVVHLDGDDVGLGAQEKGKDRVIVSFLTSPRESALVAQADRGIVGGGAQSAATLATVAKSAGAASNASSNATFTET